MKAIVVALIAGTLLGLLVIWLGIYNVAANDKHFSITSNLLQMVREHSIETRAAQLQVPDLNKIESIKEGAEHYAEMCTGCHLAPGMEETELYSGLYPQPPVFSSQDYNNSPQNQFWVIKNGLKMTGMPAWSPSHTDEQIWEMVAYLQIAKTLSAKDYQELSGASGDDHSHSHSHDDTDDHEENSAQADH